LCLLINDYTVHVRTLATDLSLPGNKVVDYLKGVGCRIDMLTSKEREATGMVKHDTRGAKKATLVAPLILPEIRQRQAKKT
jgi:hypothetical protein